MLLTTDILRKINVKWKWALVITLLSSREARALLGEVSGASHGACILSLTCVLGGTAHPWLLAPQQGQVGKS